MRLVPLVASIRLLDRSIIETRSKEKRKEGSRRYHDPAMRSSVFCAHARAIEANPRPRALAAPRYATGGTASLEKQAEIEEDANYSREEAVV